ncbi:MAG: tRNA dihydrouridine synthase DusB [Granulosicoccus sp.]|nr:tRNA dihydrouridine synthase DusB [Granulosicoccus sp.]
MQIGTHTVSNPLFLAPMAGVSDRPFRDLCAREGAGFAASEMISSDTLLFATAKTRHRIERASSDLPHAVQIAGAVPEQMADAAELNVKHGAEIIDINMGCPAKKVCNRMAGSALLEYPNQVRSILQAVVARVNVPVTLKIRTGPSPESRNGVAIARIAEQAGIAALAVHGRTRADRFKGHAEYDTIAAIVDAVTIPVIANGDIRTGDDAVSVINHTGAAGIMVGRAAQGNPWVFAEIGACLRGEPTPVRPSIQTIGQTLIEHLQGCHRLYGEYRGVRIARKHIAWYSSGLRDASAFRAAVYQTETAIEQLRQVEQFFDCAVAQDCAA